MSGGSGVAARATRWRTGGAILRPPPPRLVAISRRLTSRLRRHGRDVTNGTSHGPPASSRLAPRARRPPEPALTASLVRSGALLPLLPQLPTTRYVSRLSFITFSRSNMRPKCMGYIYMQYNYFLQFHNLSCALSFKLFGKNIYLY